MPELPEVEALAAFLRERLSGRVVADVEVGALSVLKTVDPPPSALHGLAVTGVVRRGTWLDLDVDGLHLLVHLSRAGRLRWSDALPTAPLRPSGKNPVALRVRLAPEDEDDPARPPGFDLTEAGTQKRLAVHVVREPTDVAAVAALGPDPLAEDFGPASLAALLAGSRRRVEGLLRDQSVLAGVGNAYSDEVLHAARLSPYALAGNLSPEEVERLHTCLRDVLRAAVAAAAGRPAAQLEDAERAGTRVHGRTGQPCPVCGDVVRKVSFAERSLQYCPTCQTGGKLLADRRLSRLLK
ncbi:Fpg/Nei family DNA glycosylase [Kineococcus sp. SYSU DK004]|uniref:Fpg/Nei family DNA glycosylase n=1 Tax=Kineococcus sp. SYSU DK004 TaxID=3383125 RepID=UPI003D7EEE37